MTAPIAVDPEAVTAIRRHARNARLFETGGALFGYESSGAGDAVTVIFAGSPGPRAVHRPTGLVADSTHTQRLIDLVADHTDGSCRYIGSWHTHPTGRAVPSRRDAHTARAISAQPEVQLPRPLLLIAATWPSPAGQHLRHLTAWRLDAHGHALGSHPIRTMPCNRWPEFALS